MSRRWRYPRSRRGAFYPVPPMVVAPPVGYLPAFQEPSGRSSRLVGMRVRRGRFTQVLRAVCPPPRSTRRVQVRLAATRRGRFFPVPPATRACLPPQRAVRRRTVAPVTRRGRFYFMPPTVPVGAPVTWAPAFPSTRTRRALRSRAGRAWGVPLVGLAPAVVETPTSVTVTPRSYLSTASARDAGESTTVRQYESTATVRSPQ